MKHHLRHTFFALLIILFVGSCKPVHEVITHHEYITHVRDSVVTRDSIVIIPHMEV